MPDHSVWRNVGPKELPQLSFLLLPTDGVQAGDGTKLDGRGSLLRSAVPLQGRGNEEGRRSVPAEQGRHPRLDAVRQNGRSRKDGQRRVGRGGGRKQGRQGLPHAVHVAGNETLQNGGPFL